MNATIQSVYRLACWLRITKVGNKAGPAIPIYAIPHRAHTKTAFIGATTPSRMAQPARKDRHAEKSPGTGSVRAIHRFPRRCHGITQTTSPWMIYEKSTAVYRPRYECHAVGEVSQPTRHRVHSQMNLTFASEGLRFLAATPKQCFFLWIRGILWFFWRVSPCGDLSQFRV